MIFQEGRNYTFSQYAEFPYPTSEVLAELGYAYEIAPLHLPRFSNGIDTEPLQRQMIQLFPHVDFVDEFGKREFYITPLWQILLRHIPFHVSIEYRIDLPDYPKLSSGYVDYVMRGAQNVVVIEAKRGDMERGFTQLAAEMIAVSIRLQQPRVYGAITIGDLWRFGIVDDHKVTKDVYSFALPGQLAELCAILAGLLKKD